MEMLEDAPDDLNFAMFLAQHYGIIPNQAPFIASRSPRLFSVVPMPVADQDIVRDQWYAWWTHLMASHQSRMQWNLKLAFEEDPGQNCITAEHLAKLPEPLRTYSTTNWPIFDAWWHCEAGGKSGTIHSGSCTVEPFNTINVVEETCHATPPSVRWAIEYLYTGWDFADPMPLYALVGVDTQSSVLTLKAWLENQAFTLFRPTGSESS